MARKAADKLVADWLTNGIVTIDVSDRKAKLNGLRVAQWL
jgi:hypothetical protein